MIAGRARKRSSWDMSHWPDMPVADAILEGLAVNPALPEDLLLRLIRDHAGPAVNGLEERRPLSPAAAEAMAAHPDPWVRAALTGNDTVDPELRLRLHDDPDPLVREHMYRVRDLPRPESALHRALERYERLARRGLMTDAELIGELIEDATREKRLVQILAKHPDERFRAAVCTFRTLSPESRTALLNDDSAMVRERIAGSIEWHSTPRTEADVADIRGIYRGSLLLMPLTRDLLDRLLAEDDEDDLKTLAYSEHTPPDAAEVLLTHPNPAVRRSFAKRPTLTSEQAIRLGTDPDVSVRTIVSLHPVLTEEQRAAIDIDPSTSSINDLPHNPGPERVAAWAESVNVLLRRWAATRSGLSAESAARLATDPDHRVRISVGRHQPSAPPALMLEAYLAAGSGCCHTRPIGPGFPTHGMARFATDPDPANRLLAGRDPELDPDVAERLLTDPDDDVRWALARSPHIPVRRMIALLDDPELRGAAAANPSLPIPEMARLIGSPDVAVAPVADDRRELGE